MEIISSLKPIFFAAGFLTDSCNLMGPLCRTFSMRIYGKYLAGSSSVSGLKAQDYPFSPKMSFNLSSIMTKLRPT